MSTRRLSLVERQQKLIGERRWWSGPAEAAAVGAPPSSSRTSKLSFAKRQDEAAIRQGRGNATAASRHAAAMPDHDDIDVDDGNDGAASSASRLSHTPSLHPSMAGTVVSKACSEVTIGAGDDTGYCHLLPPAPTFATSSMLFLLSTP